MCFVGSLGRCMCRSLVVCQVGVVVKGCVGVGEWQEFGLGWIWGMRVGEMFEVFCIWGILFQVDFVLVFIFICSGVCRFSCFVQNIGSFQGVFSLVQCMVWVWLSFWGVGVFRWVRVWSFFFCDFCWGDRFCLGCGFLLF